MMKIYELKNDSDTYKWLETKEDKEAVEFNGLSLVDKWVPWEVTTSKKKRELPDSPALCAGVKVVNDKTKRILENVLQNEVEFLPLNHPSESFWIIHVINVVNAVDYDTAIPFRATPTIITHFKKHGFYEGKLANQWIFKLPEMPLTRIYVTEIFKEVIEQNKLTGFKFEEVWDSESEGGD